jgi:hypothetical protein
MKIKIYLNNIPVTAILDTGASRSVVSRSTADAHGVQWRRSSVPMRVIGEKRVEAAGEGQVVVEIAGLAMPKHEVLIIEDDVCNHSVVLGLDFLTVNRMEITARDRTIKKYFDVKGKSFMEIYLEEDGHNTEQMANNLFCYASEDLVIPAGCTREVKIIFPEIKDHSHTMLFTDDSMEAKLQSQVRGFSGLCEVTQRKVLLAASEDTRIKKNQVVGSMSSVVEIEEKELTKNVTEEQMRLFVSLPELPVAQQESIFKMMFEVSDVFSTGDTDVNEASVTEHRIHLYDETPIYQRPYRVAPPVADELERQCQELNSLNIIEPSKSPWSAPMVPIRKADGSIRLCIDYRKLNRVTIPDKFPVPNLTDSIYGLTGTKFFTSLDLVRGYYQIPLHKDSRKYTAFSTARNHWQFRRLSFGLCNAPAAFQREIQAVLSSFPSNKVIVYIDDILIMGTSFEEHFDLVRKVLATLSSHKIKIKPSKCKWFAKSVPFLGHIISEEGIKKTPQYIQKISEYPQPETVGKLREFLGFLNFQRKFLPNCSELQKPLSCLTGGRRSKVLKWTPEMTDAFTKLKKEMQHDLELSYPDYSEGAEKLELWVDASAYGAGAYLAQNQSGCHKVIGFASMTFTPAQLNYSTLDRELTALRWGVKTFKPFLFGIPFILYTDHQPLAYMHTMKSVCPKMARTEEDLDGFIFQVLYTPGHLNTAADALSRLGEPPFVPVDRDTNAVPDDLLVDGPPTPGGGDSMFVSLYKLLSRLRTDLPRNSHELRSKIVNELINNSTKYKLKLDIQSRHKLKLMCIKDVLPSFDVLLAASELFSVQILVYFWSGQPVIYRYAEYEDVIHLQCLGGVHFNPLRPLKDFKVPDRESCTEVNCNSPQLKNVAHCTDDDLTDCDSEGDFEFINNLLDVNTVSDVGVISCGHFQDNGGQLQVTVLLDNLQFCAIVDTGAELSLVSDTLLAKLKLNSVPVIIVNERLCNVIGLNGEITPITKTAMIKFSIGDIKMNKLFKFAVVPESVFPQCFLLGLDFQDEFYLTVNLDRGMLTDKSGAMAKMSTYNPLNEFRNMFLLNTVTEHNTLSHTLNVVQNVDDIRIELNGDDEYVTGLEFLLPNDELGRLQDSDDVVKAVKDAMTGLVPTNKWKDTCNEFKRHCNKLCVINNVLYYDNKKKIAVVPFNILTDLVVMLHYRFSHIGRDKMLHMLYDLVWHPCKYKVVSDMCTTCPDCQINKMSSVTIVPPRLKICTSYPFELMAVDLISLPKTAKGYVACLMCVDHYTKWVSAVPIRNKTGLTVANALMQQVLPFLPKVPTKILSDNGPEFISSQFGEVLGAMGIIHQFTTPFCPTSNGAIERVNRTIQGFLRSLTDKPGSWDQHLPQAIITYNNTLHVELNLSPSSFLLNRSHNCNSVPLLNVPKLQEFWKTGHSKFSPFKVGQLVLMKIPSKGNLTVNKLSKKYKGPLIVNKVNSNNVTYVLSDPSSTNTSIRAHHTDLYPFKTIPSYLRDHPWFERLESCHVSDDPRSIRLPPVQCSSDSSDSDEEYLICDSTVSGTCAPVESDTSQSSESSIISDNCINVCSQCSLCKFESQLESVIDTSVNNLTVEHNSVLQNISENISAVHDENISVDCDENISVGNNENVSVVNNYNLSVDYNENISVSSIENISLDDDENLSFYSIENVSIDDVGTVSVNNVENVSAIGTPLFNVNCETWEMSDGESSLSFLFNVDSHEVNPSTANSHVSQVEDVDANKVLFLDNESKDSDISNESITKLEEYIDEMYEDIVVGRTQSVRSLVQLEQTREKGCEVESMASPTNSIVVTHTRSRGPAPIYPNVQELILERKRKP